MEDYRPFGAEWELEMLKFKKQDLVEMLRASLKKNKDYESSQLEPLVSLPCPFCANTKIRTWQTEDEYWHIQCNSDVCGACMDDFTTEQEAIKQWNVRSN